MHANLSLKMCELLKCLHTSVTVFAQVQSQHAFGVTTETKVFGAHTQYNFTPFLLILKETLIKHSDQEKRTARSLNRDTAVYGPKIAPQLL